jgi:hypothetical protein
MEMGRLLGGCAVLAAVAVFAPKQALGQQTRFYTVSVAPGQTQRFDNWLNFDETTCADRGHPRFTIVTPPRLGRLRVERTRVVQQSGFCAGKRMSVLFVHYTGGRRPGTETFSYSVVGQAAFTVNVTGTVR